MRCVKSPPGCVAAPESGGTLDVGDAARAHTSKEKQRMDAENVVGLIVALALLGYLVAALIRPERF